MTIRHNRFAFLFFLIFCGVAESAQVQLNIEDDWGAGYVAKLVIDNSQGDKDVETWQVDLSLGRDIASMWNGSFEQNADLVTVLPIEWNRMIPKGGKIEIGFQGAPGGFNGIVPSVELIATYNASGGGGPEPDTSIACGVDPSVYSGTNDWLSTDGNLIVDSQGNPVWLTGANWFGLNTTERILHGIWTLNMHDLIEEIAERGMNVLRIPIATELIKEWMAGDFKAAQVNFWVNKELEGMNTLEIFDRFLDAAKACGIKVVLDVHHPHQDNTGHTYWGWEKDEITLDDFYSTWEWMAERYKNNDTIVGFDIQNEPHGQPDGTAGNELIREEGESWEEFCQRKPETTASDFAKWDGTKDENNWRYIAEEVSKRILAIHPNILIMVEGVEAYPRYDKWVNHKRVSLPSAQHLCYYFNWWGGNLRGVRDYPVRVPGFENKIVYSPHEYGPAVYMQPWFRTEFTRNSLREDVWSPNWLYIHNDGIAPLFIGEWGGILDGGDNERWMNMIRDEIAELQLHHTFWSINPNSGDTGGLLATWQRWDTEKLSLLTPALWKDNAGKFVSLDHEAPLAGNKDTGVSLVDFYRR